MFTNRTEPPISRYNTQKVVEGKDWSFALADGDNRLVMKPGFRRLEY